MSIKLRNLNYKLENKNEDEPILYDRSDLNKLSIAENENLNHFSAKEILFYILSEMNHDLISDFEIIGVGKADIFDLTTRTMYIFDPSGLKEYWKNIDELYENSEVDVIAINIDELPDDIFQRYLKLREYVITH